VSIEESDVRVLDDVGAAAEAPANDRGLVLVVAGLSSVDDLRVTDPVRDDGPGSRYDRTKPVTVVREVPRCQNPSIVAKTS
jgi:hypothetical protein